MPALRKKSLATALAPQSGDKTLAIVYRKLETLVSDATNPRLHSERQIQQIAQSIKAFGFNVPFLIDRRLKLIAGHGRLAACKLLGIQRVPTIRLDHLTEHQARAFMIADNRLTENAAWDGRLLAEQLKILSEAELDFTLETTGFEMGEIDVMLEGLVTPAEQQNDDRLPASCPTKIVSKRGDLWILDRNRILCGDALDGASYETLMGKRRAAAVFTDPPYNDPIDGYVTGFGKVHHPEFAMASGEMTRTEFTSFLAKTFAQLTRASSLGALHYVCMDWRHAKEVLDASDGIYTELMNMCVWVKESGGQGSFYRSQHELVFVFKHGKDRHCNNVQLGRFSRYRTNVWEYSRVSAGAEKELTGAHPTIKPVALVADAIQDCTARGEIVLDAFLGSGTTLVAAERTGRICYGIELAPVYLDLAIRRWQAFTGKTAIHAGTGQSFSDLEEVLHE